MENFDVTEKSNLPRYTPKHELNIKAVAFDIDGTLYPAWKLFIRMPLYFVRHLFFYLHFGKVRKQLRRLGVLQNFYEKQAELMAARLNISVDASKEKVDGIAYSGISHYFEKIKPYKDIEETFRLFHEAGLKVGILSDFPVAQKGDVWGCLKYADVSISSEDTGALKPSPHAFTVLAEKLGISPEQILYVGNNLKYDVGGAASIGMKTAYIETVSKRIFHRGEKPATILFHNFKQLQKAVLSHN